MSAVSTLYKAHNTLGESPFWDADFGRIFWVDIEEGNLHEFIVASGAVQTWRLGRRVSVILASSGTDLLLGCPEGIMRFSFLTEELSLVVPLPNQQPRQRCNDGACDAEGRLWVGVMDIHCAPGLGSLYRIDESLEAVKMLDNLTIPNGLVFSADNKHMYFIDTPTRVIKSYHFDAIKGLISFDKAVVRIPENMGMPDGMTIDEEGMLWVALYGGAAVTRWNPLDGQLLKTIKLPALNITNCCFGGEHLDELIVTSARENMTAAQLLEYPESGSLFSVTQLSVGGPRTLSHKPLTTFFLL